MSKKKVLVIGWDAAEWKVIMPLIQQGKMPAFARLMSRGVHGKLQTLDPPLSPMLWTSIATGFRADKHGIGGFIEHPQPRGL
jgi:predicted AlkP superfamily phosphohydrolase/phosphomutase